jgi:adenylate cyclase
MGATLALAVFAVVAAAFSLGAFQRLEAITYDYRLRWARSEAEPHPDIAVILIDEASLEAMNPVVGRFPWPRSVYADLIQFLQMGGARAVVFDLLFSEHQRDARGNGLGADDRRLTMATAAAGNVFHAAQALPGDGSRRLQPPFPALREASAGLGVVTLDADADGVYRRARLRFATSAGERPALGLAALPADAGRDAPRGPDGRVLVNMAGDFEPYSAGGVLRAIQQLRRGQARDLAVYPDEFANKVVFVGASAAGLEDIKTTGLSQRTPGVLIHASLASSLLSGNLLAPVPRGLTLALAAAFAAAAMVLVLGSRRLALQLLGPLALATAFTVWSLWRFQNGVVYAVTPPLTALGLSWLAGTGLLAVTEGREKQRVRRMFSQYVSPEVLSELTARPGEHLAAEVGRTEHLTVLFSDIRGFTTLSENLPPDRVVELLNVYLSAMSEVILDARGTVDKFVGDALMAFWGAPVRLDDHAQHGVRAALAMERRLPEVNRRLQALGCPELASGIGLHTADVILGNIGSERKLDYTVIGDSVNLASRLEGLTKVYGCPILVSEDTVAELGEGFVCGLVDRVRVKGRSGATAVYRPLALPEDDAGTRAAALERAGIMAEAFAAYRERHWQQADDLYARLPEDWPLRTLFRERCAAFRAEPPGPDWDGVYTPSEK